MATGMVKSGYASLRKKWCNTRRPDCKETTKNAMWNTHIYLWLYKLVKSSGQAEETHVPLVTVSRKQLGFFPYDFWHVQWGYGMDDGRINECLSHIYNQKGIRELLSSCQALKTQVDRIYSYNVWYLLSQFSGKQNKQKHQTKSNQNKHKKHCQVSVIRETHSFGGPVGQMGFFWVKRGKSISN